MISFHPRSLRLRQVIPAVFVLSLAALGLGSIVFPAWKFLLGAEVVLYAVVNAGFSLREGLKQKSPALTVVLPWVYACIHLSWGTGFWGGFVMHFGRLFRSLTGGK